MHVRVKFIQHISSTFFHPNWSSARAESPSGVRGIIRQSGVFNQPFQIIALVFICRKYSLEKEDYQWTCRLYWASWPSKTSSQPYDVQFLHWSTLYCRKRIFLWYSMDQRKRERPTASVNRRCYCPCTQKSLKIVLKFTFYFPGVIAFLSGMESSSRFKWDLNQVIESVYKCINTDLMKCKSSVSVVQQESGLNITTENNALSVCQSGACWEIKCAGLLWTPGTLLYVVWT